MVYSHKHSTKCTGYKNRTYNGQKMTVNEEEQQKQTFSLKIFFKSIHEFFKYQTLWRVCVCTAAPLVW